MTLNIGSYVKGGEEKLPVTVSEIESVGRLINVLNRLVMWRPAKVLLKLESSLECRSGSGKENFGHHKRGFDGDKKREGLTLLLLLPTTILVLSTYLLCANESLGFGDEQSLCSCCPYGAFISLVERKIITQML